MSFASISSKRGSYRHGYAMAYDKTPLFYETFTPLTPVATLVFCDGIGCEGYIWKYLTHVLADEYQLIHLHYRGHGKTPTPRNQQAVSIEHLADDVAAVLEACNISQAILFGHSMGVQVVLETYRRHPNTVLGLGLLCGSHSYPLRTFRGKDTLEHWLPWIQRLVLFTFPISNWVWARLAPTVLAYKLALRVEVNGRISREEDFAPFFEGIARLHLPLFLRMLTFAGQHHAFELLPQIKVPTFILAGRKDSFTPLSLSLEMREHIPTSELYIVEEGSHATPIERPLEVTGKVTEFLTRYFDPTFNKLEKGDIPPAK